MLELKFLFSKSKTFKIEEIVSYGTTEIKVKSLSLFGIVICTSSELKYLLSDLSLDNYTPIEQYLMSADIKNTGEEKYSIFWQMLDQ